MPESKPKDTSVEAPIAKRKQAIERRTFWKLAAWYAVCVAFAVALFVWGVKR